MSAAKQTEINAAVQKFLDKAFKTAAELADKYDKKPRYFLDLFFQGGAHMVGQQKEVNPYNAFKNEKAIHEKHPNGMFGKASHHGGVHSKVKIDFL
ncbi:hypothetical protein DFH08DRAFT_963705 [Mycena albidolilacea]|uniref:Uncharacterized protein n=1 Tax=Mycena albidolilacea TaxID=1033008 RepID=A0AAD6ZV63_9AGAR|nr:hypothetical protein DFH08DRAFT_963705 [Mycena albidolilacea]